MHFCTIAAPDDARVQKRTALVRNCTRGGSRRQMAQKCTPAASPPSAVDVRDALPVALADLTGAPVRLLFAPDEVGIDPTVGRQSQRQPM